MDIRIPAPVEQIIAKLNQHGYEAYIVGGCVRDMLLGREPGDWDITTSALPGQVKEIFRRTIDTGIQHGTVTVMTGSTGYEVTTYRIDGEYEDGRHPNSVSFTPNLTEDLKRRDFTINAMACNGSAGIVDEFGGQEDLKRRVIRCVGRPMDRFTEDALRILRAIRFSAQLDFSIEAETYEAIRVIAPNLSKVSKERIQVELTKLLLSSHPERMAMVYETGISPYVSGAFHEAYGTGALYRAETGAADESREMPASIPGVTSAIPGIPAAEPGIPAAESGIPTAIPEIPTAIPPLKHLRWAAFLRGVSPEQAAEVLKDLKLDNDTIYQVKTLVGLLHQKLEPYKPALRRVMSPLEPRLYDELLELKLVLAGSCGPDAAEMREPAGGPDAADMRVRPGVLDSADMPESTETLVEIRRLSQEIRRDGDCLTLKMLALSGHDLMEAGVRPGRAVGQTLQRLLELVLDDPGRNTREYLLQHLK